MITDFEVQDALRSLLSTRAAYASALDLHEPKNPEVKLMLPSPPGAATQVDIENFEAAVGRIPPSYRHFLQMHDGIPKFDVGSDLLPVSLILSQTRVLLNPPPAGMLSTIQRTEVDGLLVIGATTRGTVRFLFDTTQADEDDEWKVVEYSAPDELFLEHKNFYEFLRDATDVMREAGGLD
jgi:hypothetical protein